MPPVDDDRRARDCLGELTHRRAVGEDLLDRVSLRRTQGPRWSRVFERLGVPDPYDADAEEQPFGLGPVGVKLADRRRPAPHARPPQGPQDAPPAARPQPEGRPKPLRLAEPPAPNPPPPVPAAVAAAANPGDPGGDSIVLPERPREVPMLPGPNVQKPKSRTGRVRMAPRLASSGPRVKEIPAPESVLGADSVAAAEPEEPVVQRAPPGPDLGLDDLFGFSGGGGRMKRPKKDEDPE